MPIKSDISNIPEKKKFNFEYLPYPCLVHFKGIHGEYVCLLNRHKGSSVVLYSTYSRVGVGTIRDNDIMLIDYRDKPDGFSLYEGNLTLSNQ
jgi:hypothetical protein